MECFPSKQEQADSDVEHDSPHFKSQSTAASIQMNLPPGSSGLSAPELYRFSASNGTSRKEFRPRHHAAESEPVSCIPMERKRPSMKKRVSKVAGFVSALTDAVSNAANANKSDSKTGKRLRKVSCFAKAFGESLKRKDHM